MSSDPRIIPALSSQFILYPIEGKDENGVLDPTGFPVEFAFLVQDATLALDTIWYTGSWTTEVQDFLPNIYRAQIKIGPNGAVALTAGSWDVYIRITAITEVPIEKVDTILIV